MKTLYFIYKSLEKLKFNQYENVPWFINNLNLLLSQLRGSEFTISKIFPIVDERFSESGVAKGHYFHQDLLVAQMIFKNNPVRHVDIASRVDGFVSHVASFREIDVFDIRPLESMIENINFIKFDLMTENKAFFEFTDSISCLHAIEHFGLGRYGDSIDANGHLKGLNSIYNILKKNGIFYFSTPIGPQRIEYNAHRVFSMDYLIELFTPLYDIISFSYVDDNGDLHKNADINNLLNRKNNYGCHYGCGIFTLMKK